MPQSEGKAQAVPIREEPIELSQFLKVANVVMTGGEAKALIQDGAVLVNGAVETRRSHKLKQGDTVEVAGQVRLQVTLETR